MTILESILAYMAGEAQSLPATTNTKVLTVSNELAAEWAEIPSDNT